MWENYITIINYKEIFRKRNAKVRSVSSSLLQFVWMLTMILMCLISIIVFTPNQPLFFLWKNTHFPNPQKVVSLKLEQIETPDVEKTDSAQKLGYVFVYSFSIILRFLIPFLRWPAPSSDCLQVLTHPPRAWRQPLPDVYHHGASHLFNTCVSGILVVRFIYINNQRSNLSGQWCRIPLEVWCNHWSTQHCLSVGTPGAESPPAQHRGWGWMSGGGWATCSPTEGPGERWASLSVGWEEQWRVVKALRLESYSVYFRPITPPDTEEHYNQLV